MTSTPIKTSTDKPQLDQSSHSIAAEVDGPDKPQVKLQKMTKPNISNKTKNNFGIDHC